MRRGKGASIKMPLCELEKVPTTRQVLEVGTLIIQGIIQICPATSYLIKNYQLGAIKDSVVQIRRPEVHPGDSDLLEIISYRFEFVLNKSAFLMEI